MSISPPPMNWEWNQGVGKVNMVDIVHCIVLKWQITFNLGLNIDKNTDNTKKKVQVKIIQN